MFTKASSTYRAYACLATVIAEHRVSFLLTLLTLWFSHACISHIYLLAYGCPQVSWRVLPLRQVRSRFCGLKRTGNTLYFRNPS